MLRKYYVVFLILLCCLLFGCWDDDSPGNSFQTSIFQTTLKLLNRYGDNIAVSQQGNPITLRFSFRNVSGEIQTLHLSSTQEYDLQVYDSHDTLVWNWANDKAFLDVLTELVFDVGETKEYEETWDQTANDGTQVPAGIYPVYVNRFWDSDRSTGPKLIEIE
jgi:hypothetical protein